MAKQHIEGIHFIRILAAVLVIVTHVASKSFLTVGPNWEAVNIYFGVARVCVPLFFLTSGFLLMDKIDEDIWHFYGKSLKRIALPTLFFSLLFYLNPLDSPWLNAKRIVYGQVSFHLWYVYALVGLYLFIPFGRVLIAAAAPKYILIYLGIAIVSDSLIPMFQTLRAPAVWLPSVYNLGLFTGFVMYLFIGYKLKTAFPAPGKWLRALLLAGFALASAGSIWLSRAYSLRIGTPSEALYVYTNPLVMLAAICLFAALKDLSIPERWKRSVLSVSTCTFGIYLVHIFALHHVLSVASFDFNRVFSIPLLTLITFALSYGIVWSLRYIKPLRPFVG